MSDWADEKARKVYAEFQTSDVTRFTHREWNTNEIAAALRAVRAETLAEMRERVSDAPIWIESTLPLHDKVLALLTDGPGGKQ